MKKQSLFSNYISIGVTVFLIMIILWGLIGLLGEEETVNEVRVAVIVEDNSSSRWTAFQLGLEKAAKDQTVDLAIVPTGKFTDAREALELTRQRISEGTDGVILAPYDTKCLGELLDGSNSDTQIMLVENDMDRTAEGGSGVFAAVPDYGNIGQTLAEEIRPTLANKAGEKKVSVIYTNGDVAGVKTALSYIRESLSDDPSLLIEEHLVKNDPTFVRLLLKKTDAIIALDDESLAMAAGFKESVGTNIPVCGIGVSDENVICLEQGIISCMIVPNYFRMGYEGLTTLVEKIRNHNDYQGVVSVGYLMVHPDEVHNPENEKILFPIVQ